MIGGGHGLNTNASTGHVANMMQYTNNEMTCSSKVHASHVALLFMQSYLLLPTFYGTGPPQLTLSD